MGGVITTLILPLLLLVPRSLIATRDGERVIDATVQPSAAVPLAEPGAA